MTEAKYDPGYDDRPDSPCECGAVAVERQCDECGREGWMLECGHQQQPRPISADGHVMLCDECAECADNPLRNMMGRVNADGNVDVLTADGGEWVTRIDVDALYPIGSHLSTRWEHAAGITITPADAMRVGLEIEGCAD